MTRKYTLPLSVNEIQKHLPHRPPMLMLDRVLEFTETTLKAEKKANEDAFYFQGHFPGNPIMPGVMIVESIAQSGALLAALNRLFDTETHLLAFAGIQGAKFRRPVSPNETLCVCVEIVKQRRNLYKFAGHAEVEGSIVTQLMFSAASSPRF